MKSTLFGKVRLLQLGVILVCTGALYVVDADRSGALPSPWLRESVQPLLHRYSDAFESLKFRFRGPTKPKNKIVVVEIDDPAIEAIGRWPWHRDVIAYLIQQTFEAGAKVVSLDMLLPEPDIRIPPELETLLKEQGLGDRVSEFDTDRALAQVIAAHRKRLVLGWATAQACRPNWAGKEGCPVTDPELIKALPSSFKRAGVEPSGAVALAPNETPLLSAPSVVANLPRFQRIALHAGLLEAWPGADGVIRRQPMVVMVGGRALPSLGLAMALAGLEDTLEVELDPEQQISRIGLSEAKRDIPVDRLGNLRMNLRGPAHSFDYVPMLEVIQDRDAIQLQRGKAIVSASKQALFKDAYVLIGLTALGTGDVRSFAMDPVTPGVEGHATVLDNILSGDPLRDRPDVGGLLWLYGLMTLGALIFIFALERRGALFLLLVFATTTAGLLAVDLQLFIREDISLPSAFLYLELVVLFGVALATRYLREEERKKFIQGAFSSYISPNLVQYLLDHPEELEVGGSRRECSFVMTDLAGFTKLVEKADPAMVVGILNEYLDGMVKIALGHGGTLDRIVGDAVAVMFSAPIPQEDHAERAVTCALAMDRYCDTWQQEKLALGIPVGITRIGVNTGEVTIGNVGGEMFTDYRALGDTVNTTARLETVNNQLGTRMCVAASTAERCAAFSGRPVGRLVLKGKSEGIAAFEPMVPEVLSSEPVQAYLAAYALMKAEDPAALAAFAALAGAHPDDPLARFHADRLEAGQTGETVVFTKK